MMNVGGVQAFIRLRDDFSSVADRVSHSLDRMNKQVKPLTASFSTLGSVIGSIALSRFVGELTQAQVASQRMTNTMVAATGSFKVAGEEMAFVREQAEKFGLSIQTAAQSYAQMKVAVAGTSADGAVLHDVFIGLSEAVTAMGLDAQTAEGAMRALTQMFSKSNVMAEELRGQLGERIPGAFRMMAQGMGVTEQQLNKMLEQSQVLAVDAIPKLAKVWHETFGDAALKASHSLAAEMNRLKTTLFDLFDGMSRSMDMAGIVSKLRDLFEQFRESGKAEELMRKLGDAIKDFLDTVSRNLPAFLDNFDRFLAIAKTLVEIQLARWVLTLASSLITLTKAAGPIGLLAGALLLLANNLEAFSNTMQREIDKIVEGTNKLGTAVQLIRRMGVDFKTTGAAVISEAELDTVAGLIADTSAQIQELKRLREQALNAKPKPIDTGNAADDARSNRILQDEFSARKAGEVAKYDAEIQRLSRDLENYSGILQNASVKQDANNKKRAVSAKLVDKESTALKKLLKEIEIQRKVLEFFGAALDATNNDFEQAERLADAFKDVLKAGVDPASELGQELMRQGVALRELEAEYEKAKDAAKELGKAQEDAIEANREFGETVLELKTAFEERFRQAQQQVRLSKEQAANELALAKAAMEGADAYRALAKEQAIQAEILSRLGTLDDFIKDGGTAEQWQKMAGEIRASTGELIDFHQNQEKIATTTAAWSGLLHSIDDVLGGLGSGLASIVEGFGAIKAAAGATEATLKGWASILEGVGSIMKSMGVFQQGSGGFGGSPESNYAAEGQAIGAIIGGIIGSLASMPQVGMAIGGAAGGIIGGFVKKGADEALASLTIDMSGFTTVVNKAEGELGSSISELGTNIALSFHKMLAAIGGTFAAGLPQVDMKIRDGVISVVVGAVKKRFKEMDDAISFAVAELLKQGEIFGLDDMIRDALANTNASSLEGLAADLDAVMKVLSFGMTESQQAIFAFTNELDGLRAHMAQVLGNTEQLTRALANLAIEEGRRWQSLRDQITGHQMSQAEIRKMKEQDAMMFNAEKALRLAELRLTAMRLEAQKTALVAEGQMSQARARMMVADLRMETTMLSRSFELTAIQVDMWNAELDAGQAYLNGRNSLAGSQVDLYNAELDAQGAFVNAQFELLQAQIDAINQLIDIISAIPDIDIGEIRIPGIGGGVGGGGFDDGPSDEEREEEQRQRDLESLWDTLRGIFTSINDSWFSKLEDLKFAMLEQIELAHEDAAAIAAINQAYEAQVEALEQDALASLGIESINLTNRFAELADTLRFLTERGAITADQMRELGQSMYISLVDSLLQYVDNEEVRMQLEDLRFRMEMANYMLQFELLKGLGILLEAEIMVIQGLIEDIWEAYAAGQLDFQQPSMPTFDPPGSGGGGDGMEDTLSDLRRAIDRLRSAVDNLREFQEGMTLSGVTPLTIAEQFAEAQAHYQEILQRALEGDITAIEELPDAAQAFLELAAQMFGTAGMGYQEIFQMVHDQVGEVIDFGQGFLDALPPEFQSVVDELDTMQEILAAMQAVNLQMEDSLDTGFAGVIAALGRIEGQLGLDDPPHIPPGRRGEGFMFEGGGDLGAFADTYGGPMVSPLGDSYVPADTTPVIKVLNRIDRRLSTQNTLTFDGNRQAKAISMQPATTKTVPKWWSNRRGG